MVSIVNAGDANVATAKRSLVKVFVLLFKRIANCILANGVA